MGDNNDGDSYPFSSAAMRKKKPRKLNIKQPLVQADDDDDIGASDSMAIPPPSRPSHGNQDQPMEMTGPSVKKSYPTKTSSDMTAATAASLESHAAGSFSYSASPPLMESSSSSSSTISESGKEVSLPKGPPPSAFRPTTQTSPSSQSTSFSTYIPPSQRTGRSPTTTQERIDIDATDTTASEHVYNPTMFNTYRQRSRSRSRGSSGREEEGRRKDNSSSPSGSGSSSSSDSESTDSVDEMYKKYRKYLSASDSNDDDNGDAPWRKVQARDKTKPKLNALPSLEYTYQYTTSAEQTSQEQEEQRKQEMEGKKTSRKPSQKLKSDKLPADDLKTLGMMLLGGDEESSNDGTMLSSEHYSMDTDDEHSTQPSQAEHESVQRSHSSGSSHGGILQFVDKSSEEDDEALLPGNQRYHDTVDYQKNAISEEDVSLGEEIVDDGDDEEKVEIQRSQPPTTARQYYAKRLSPVADDGSGSSRSGSSRSNGDSTRQIKSVRKRSSNDPQSFPRKDVPMDRKRFSTAQNRSNTGRSNNDSGSWGSSGSRTRRDSFNSGNLEDSQRQESDHYMAEAAILSAGLVAAAAVASSQPEEGKQTQPRYQRSKAYNEEQRASVTEETKNLESKSRLFATIPGKRQEVQAAVAEDLSESAETEDSKAEDFSALWELNVKEESNDLLEESFGSGRQRRTGSRSLTSKRGQNNNNDDSLSQQSGAFTQSKNSLEDSSSLGRSWKEQEDLADSLPSYMRRMADSPTQGKNDMEMSMRVHELSSLRPSTRVTGRGEIIEEESLRVQELSYLQPNKRMTGSGGLMEEEESLMLSGFGSSSRQRQFERINEDSDEYSLKASPDVTRSGELSSILENPEYDHRSKKALGQDSLNQGLQNLDISVSVNDSKSTNDVESGDISKKQEKEDSDDDSSTSTEPAVDETKPFKSPTSSSTGVRRHVVRGMICLLLLAAIGVTLYFLVWYDNNDGTDSAESPQQIPPLIPPSPSNGTPSPATPPSNVFDPTSSPIAPVPLPSPPVVSPTPPPATVVPQPSVPSLPVGAEELREFLISQWPSLEEDLQIVTSPQYLAFDWLANNPGLEEYTDERKVQRFALATLYYSTDGNNWRRNDRWLTDEHECLWYTASNTLPCDDDLFYTILDLDLNGLSGTIPAELALLSNSLIQLDLSTRDSAGKVLTGSLPQELGFLSNTESISLSGNQLEGSLPVGVGKWMRILSIDLSGNRFNGELPFSVAHLGSLAVLDLADNQFEGSLPSYVGSMTGLQFLDLSNNSFTGPIPPEIGQLTLLQELSIQHNLFTSLPTEIGNLVLLQQFLGQENNISGRLPSEMGRLINLLNLDLSENSLSGSLPSQVGNLISIRDQLNLSFNQLSGPLPDDLGRLIFLRNMLLQSNLFVGNVPTTFANLDRINTLRLEDNNLRGTVPTEVCDVYSVTYPVFVTDCINEIVCDCCMFCCENDGGCECQFDGTELSFLCAEFTKSPGLEERIFGNIGK